jgi:hypothetical protein
MLQQKLAVDTKPARQFLYTQQTDCTGYFFITQIAGSNPVSSFELVGLIYMA